MLSFRLLIPRPPVGGFAVTGSSVGKCYSLAVKIVNRVTFDFHQFALATGTGVFQFFGRAVEGKSNDSNLHAFDAVFFAFDFGFDVRPKDVHTRCQFADVFVCHFRVLSCHGGIAIEVLCPFSEFVANYFWVAVFLSLLRNFYPFEGGFGGKNDRKGGFYDVGDVAKRGNIMGKTPL
jgi:hypothetical protein